MTSKTIDTLDAASALASGDKFPLAASGSDTLKRATVSQLQTYMQANLTFGGGVEVLTADRTYYVRTDGSDSNDGLSNTAGGAFLTIQKACNVAAGIVTAGHYITINVGDGTYSPFICSFPLADTAVTIQGNTTTPTNVVVSSISASMGPCAIYGFSCDSLSASGLTASAEVDAIKCKFMESASGARLYVGVVELAGNTDSAFFCTNASVILASEITLTGTPAYVSFVNCSFGLVIAFASFVGSATGQRYDVSMNGAINTFGAGATYFPGNAVGVETTGGVYA